MTAVRITGTLSQTATGQPIAHVADIAGAASSADVSGALAVASEYADGVAGAAKTAAEATAGTLAAAALTTARSDMVERLPSRPTIAALRLDTTLPERSGGHCRVACHTVAGWGGGQYRWGSYGADNDGECVRVIGRTDGAWRYIGIPSWETFGAVGDYLASSADPAVLTRDNSDALDALRTWALQDVRKRPIDYGAGVFRVTRKFGAFASYMTILARGLSTCIWVADGSIPDGEGFYECGYPYEVRGLRIGEHRISGAASPGYAVWRQRQGMYDVKLKIIVNGAWEEGYYCNEPVILEDRNGGLQWADIRISSLLDEPEGWTQTHWPKRLWKHVGYYNLGTLQIDATHCVKGCIDIESNYGDYYCVLTGSCEKSGRAFRLKNVSKLRVEKFTTEDHKNKYTGNYVGGEPNASIPDEMTNCYDVDLVSGGSSEGIIMANCHDVISHNFIGAIVEQDGTTAPTYLRGQYGGATTIGVVNVQRENMSGVSLSTSKITNPANTCGVGYGLVDPPNDYCNGDFERWNDAFPASVDPLRVPSTVAKCGEGLADTTHTRTSRYCLRINNDFGTAATWLRIYAPGQISAQAVGSVIACRFFYKYAGTSFRAALMQDPYDLSFSISPLLSRDGTSDDGWVSASCGHVITSSDVANGLGLAVAGYDYNVYVADVSSSVSINIPRVFRPGLSRVGVPATRNPDGTITERVTSIPTGNDPIFNGARILGDRAMLTVPTISGSVLTEGWVRTAGNVWTPLTRAVS